VGLPLQSPIRRYLPHILVGLSISLIMVGAYAAVGFASSSAPKALWSQNPVTIKFLGGGIGFSGSVGVSVKCAPKITNVVFKTAVSGPANIGLIISPGGQATCGPAPAVVTLTAFCVVDAPICKGTYSGTVTMLQGYSTIPPSLAVTIVVT
jgi:hypothetical protein